MVRRVSHTVLCSAPKPGLISNPLPRDKTSRNESQTCPTETKIRDRAFRHVTRRQRGEIQTQGTVTPGPPRHQVCRGWQLSRLLAEQAEGHRTTENQRAVSVLTTPGSSPLHSCVPSFIGNVEPHLTSHRYPLMGSGALGTRHLPPALTP